jgi:hypothetical protein
MPFRAKITFILRTSRIGITQRGHNAHTVMLQQVVHSTQQFYHGQNTLHEEGVTMTHYRFIVGRQISVPSIKKLTATCLKLHKPFFACKCHCHCMLVLASYCVQMPARYAKLFRVSTRIIDSACSIQQRRVGGQMFHGTGCRAWRSEGPQPILRYRSDGRFWPVGLYCAVVRRKSRRA